MACLRPRRLYVIPAQVVQHLCMVIKLRLVFQRARKAPYWLACCCAPGKLFNGHETVTSPPALTKSNDLASRTPASVPLYSPRLYPIVPMYREVDLKTTDPKREKSSSMGNTSSRGRKRRPSDYGGATAIHGSVSIKQTDENCRRAPNGCRAINDPAAATPPEIEVTRERKKAKYSHNFASDTLETAVFDFFTAPAVAEKDLKDHEPRIQNAIEKIIDLMESKGARAYLEYKAKQKEKTMTTNKKNNGKDSCADEEDTTVDGDSLIRCDPRSYQTALLEIAKQQNTIVHLGTGSGKTLVRIHF